MINVLRTLARAVTPIVLDIYDRARPESLLPLIARDVQRTGDPTQGKVTVEWWHAFPQLRQWIGDRETQQIFAASLEVNIKPYEITLAIDRGRIDPQGALVDDPRELAEPVVRGFIQGQVDLAASILRTNAETYDGQDFFDTDHVHPTGDVYSNVVDRGTDTAARAVDAAPTPSEVREELKVVMDRLEVNSIIRHTLVESSEASDLAVIARDFATWKAFHDLMTEERIAGDINRFRGKFRLLRDRAAGPPALSYDVIHAVPNGPRPSVFVTAKEVGGLQFDESKLFSSQLLPFGSDARYGVAAAFPQTGVRCIA